MGWVPLVFLPAGVSRKLDITPAKTERNAIAADGGSGEAQRQQQAAARTARNGKAAAAKGRTRGPVLPE